MFGMQQPNVKYLLLPVIISSQKMEFADRRNKMKRLLMISYPFPPNASAGAARSERFARYLPSFWLDG